MNNYSFLLKKKGTTLRVEALTLLAEELHSRDLGQELIDEWQIEIALASEEDIHHLVHRIRESTCPLCQQQAPPLQCISQRMIISYLIGSVYTNTMTICCHDCKKKPFLLPSILSFLVGWWSFRGLLATPYVLFNNMVEFSKSSKANQIALEHFVRCYYSTLEEYWQAEKLDELLFLINEQGG
jgi:hypothetical protein